MHKGMSVSRGQGQRGSSAQLFAGPVKDPTYYPREPEAYLQCVVCLHVPLETMHLISWEDGAAGTQNKNATILPVSDHGHDMNPRP